MEIIRLNPIPVLCVIADDTHAGIPAAWQKLEAKLSSLHGRKFYGTFQYPDGPYRACVAQVEGETAETLGLESWTIPGGKYAGRKLSHWSGNPDMIPAIFDALSQAFHADPSRPSLEFYRNHSDLICYLPIIEE